MSEANPDFSGRRGLWPYHVGMSAEKPTTGADGPAYALLMTVQWVDLNTDLVQPGSQGVLQVPEAEVSRRLCESIAAVDPVLAAPAWWTPMPTTPAAVRGLIRRHAADLFPRDSPRYRDLLDFADTLDG